MTDSDYMKREELLRLAALDAFGLLDSYESEQYTRSFHHAPATVQDEIIALQADLVSDLSLLPSDEPTPSLRDRVLARVSQAIEDEAAKLAPIASIGRRISAPGDAPDRHLRRNASIWRMVSFAMAACFVVALVLFITAGQDYAALAQRALDRVTSEQLSDEIGADYELFVNNPNAARKAMRPVGDPRNSGPTWIYVNGASEEAFLLALDLPILQAGEVYTLQARSDNSEPVRVATFTTDGFLSAIRVTNVTPERFEAGVLANVTWEILNSSGEVILTTTV